MNSPLLITQASDKYVSFRPCHPWTMASISLTPNPMWSTVTIQQPILPQREFVVVSVFTAVTLLALLLLAVAIRYWLRRSTYVNHFDRYYDGSEGDTTINSLNYESQTRRKRRAALGPVPEMMEILLEKSKESKEDDFSDYKVNIILWVSRWFSC